MNRLMENLFKSVRLSNTLNKILSPRFWSGPNANPISEDKIKGILQTKFPKAKLIEVSDVSGGCGAMFNIFVETIDFKGVSIANQHRLIYTELKDEISKIHGLHVVTKVPEG